MLFEDAILQMCKINWYIMHRPHQSPSLINSQLGAGMEDEWGGKRQKEKKA